MTKNDTAFSWVPRSVKARLIEISTLVLGGMFLAMFLQLWDFPSDLDRHKSEVIIELAGSKDELSEFRNEISEFRNELSEFKVEVGGQIAKLRVEIGELRAQNSQIMAILLEIKDDIKRSEVRQDDLASAILLLTERTVTNTARVEANGKELERLSAAIGDN